MIERIAGFALSLVIAATAVAAASQKIVWERTFGAPGTDERAHSIAPLPDGGIAVAGHRRSRVTGATVVVVMRLDASGKLLWERGYGGPASLRRLRIAVMPDATLAVVGSGEGSLLVLRLDASGSLLRKQVIDISARYKAGRSFVNVISDIAALPDGGIAIAGAKMRKRGRRTDIWVRRLDSDGKLMWKKTFGGPFEDWANAILALPDGGVAIAGAWHPPAAPLPGYITDAWILRLDRKGRLLWETKLGRLEKPDRAFSIAPLPDGGFAVAGFTASKGAGESDGWIFRLDASGRLIWDRTFGGVDKDWASGIVPLADGSFAVVGTNFSKAPGSMDGSMDNWLLRFDRGGRLLSEQWLGRVKGSKRVYSIAAFPDGGFALAGHITFEHGGTVAWIARFGSR